MQYKRNKKSVWKFSAVIKKQQQINKIINWNLKPTGSLKTLKRVSTGLQRLEVNRLLQESKCVNYQWFKVE